MRDSSKAIISYYSRPDSGFCMKIGIELDNKSIKGIDSDTEIVICSGKIDFFLLSINYYEKNVLKYVLRGVI